MVSRTSVLAAIVRLLELTLFRDGNSEYASPMEPLVRTLRCRHAQIQGNHTHLSFRGKIVIQTKEFADHPIIVGSHLKLPRQK